MMRSDITLHVGLAILLLLVSGQFPIQLAAAGTTWSVTTATDDVSDGNLAQHSGSLRFVLTHAAAGDLVSFADFDTGSSIFIGSTLTIPAGVAVGLPRSGACGSYTSPLVNIKGLTTAIAPLIMLENDTTLRNVNLGGGDVSARIVGSNVEICGVGVGIEYDAGILPLPALHSALIIDAPQAVVRQSYLNGAVVVTSNGNDTRIGDTLQGSGDTNQGVRACTITIQSGALSAARRVLVRDPFPRALSGISGAGVPGGDDAPLHANHWSLRPTITRAISSDGFATVIVDGAASPHALVDLFYETQVDRQRVAQVSADAAGAFHYQGPIPGSGVEVIAVSTLNDVAHPLRVGSSSELSGAVAVVAGVDLGTPTPAPTPASGRSFMPLVVIPAP
jgi:hypothetical protein